jgi:hypothetical protein
MRLRLLAALPLAAAAALLAAGCHPRTPPADLSSDTGQLIEQVRAAQAPLLRVQGQTWIRLEQPKQVSFTVYAAAERPDRLHLEVLDFFGNPAAVLVAAGGRFELYDARKRVVYRGAATPANLSRLVPVPVSAGELASILLGTVPLPEGAPASVAPDDGWLRLTFAREDATEAYWIGAHAAVDKAERAVAGGSAPGSWQVQFSERSERGGAWFPSALSLRSDPARVRLQLTWTEAEVNGELDPGLFELPVPKGARVVEVDEDGS